MHKYVSNCAICLKISLCSQEELSHRNAQIRVWQGLPGLILSLTKVAQHSILGSQLPSRPICLICLLHGCLLYPLNLGFQFKTDAVSLQTVLVRTITWTSESLTCLNVVMTTNHASLETVD